MMSKSEQVNYLVYVRCFTFNHASYITEAMNGFTMQQTDFPYVCGVVDDASTDGEPDVIRQYLINNFDLEDKRIVRNEETDDYLLTFARHKVNTNCYFAVFFLKYNHYKAKKKKAPYIAEWNDNVKYIAMCEGDDYWIDPLKLQKQVDIMENNPHVGLVRTNAHRLFQSENRLEENFMSKPPFNAIKDTFIDYLINGYYNAPCTHVWRAEAVMGFVMKSSYTVGNLPRFLTILKNGYSIKYLDDATAVYRVLEESASHFKSFEEAYRFAQGYRNVQYDYCQDQPIRVRLRVWWHICSVRNRRFIKKILQYIKMMIQDDFADLKRIIRKSPI